MPAWQTWVGIAFDVARQKGAQFESTGRAPPMGAQAVMTVAAEVWREDRERYEQMTEEQAREVLSRELSVD